MCARIKSISTGAPIRNIGGVYVLQILAFILKDPRILETCAIFEATNVASEYACSTSMQAANEDISLLAIILVLHSRHFRVSVLALISTKALKRWLTTRR